MRNCNSDCTRTGSHVNDAWIRVAFEPLQHGFYQMLGFRTGDQNIGRDFEEQAEKLLQWFTCQPPLQQGLKLFRFLR